MARLTWARQIAALTLIVWKSMPTPRYAYFNQVALVFRPFDAELRAVPPNSIRHNSAVLVLSWQLKKEGTHVRINSSQADKLRDVSPC
jgi:hypothetical protein